MTVSVVIPLYNGAPWIGAALESVFAQDIPLEAVIVVDDGSTDSSAGIVGSYPGVRLLRNTGKGSSVARNTGLQNVRSDFVAFLDQDDMWHPSHLRHLLMVFERHPETHVAIAEAVCFERGVPAYDPEPNSLTGFDPWTRFPFTIGVEGPSVALMRTIAVTHVGLWEECATGMGDALMFLKLSILHPLQRRSGRTIGKRIHASQQWLQVRELGEAYLGFRYDVMRRALDFRRAHLSEDPALPRYERRLETLHILRELTGLIQSGKGRAVPAAALQLESQLQGELAEYIPQAFYCLMGALFKTYDVEVLRRDRDREFLKLLDIWPDEALLTKNTLRKIIGEQPLIS